MDKNKGSNLQALFYMMSLEQENLPESGRLSFLES
jgi:hypothetical protein